MADIAFLLLIFFLVTTTIDTDKGIGLTLPPPLPPEQQPPPVKDRNMLKILVNAEGQVLIEEKASSFREIRRRVEKHVLNNGQDPKLSENPEKALVSIKTDRQTRYKSYIEALDEVKSAYRELHDQMARDQGFDSYAAYKSSLKPGETDQIGDKVPLNISVAEPEGGTGGEESS